MQLSTKIVLCYIVQQQGIFPFQYFFCHTVFKLVRSLDSNPWRIHQKVSFVSHLTESAPIGITFFSKTKSNPTKTILQGNVFLLNRSTHAKIETTLMKNKEPKIGHKVDMHTGLQLYCSYINGHPY